MLTIWGPTVVTVLVAALLHRRRPVAVRPIVSAAAPQPSHVRIIDERPLADVIPLRRPPGRAA